jgi:DNA-binding GntR family transcriptional regulator
MAPELDSTQAKWRQIYALIAADIESGRLPAGARVPSIVSLTSEYGVAVATAQKVHRALKDAGLVRAEQGIGLFVL